MDQTETEMDVDSLPQPIKDYVASQLGGKKITEAATIVKADGTMMFEVGVDKTDYLFDGDRQFVGKEDEENGEEDDKD